MVVGLPDGNHDVDYEDKQEQDQDQVDQIARQQATRHRNEATILVRNHLENHTVHNPGASSDYVTWIATLHPENADIAIDQRFFIPGNPWWTIYEESKNNNQIPTVTAVRVNDNDDEEGGRIRDDQQLQTDDEVNQPPNDNKMPSFWKTCSPLGILFGILISLPTTMIVLCLEMVALFICHFPSVVFFHIAHAISPPNCCTGVFYAIFLLLYYLFSFVDSILLLVSILVTEVLAIVALILGFFTGGIIWSHYLHQHIRRLCHGVRIVFRQNSCCCCCLQNNPPRNNIFRKNSCEEATENEDNDKEDKDNNNDGGNDIANNNNNNNNNQSKSNHDAFIEPIVTVAVNHVHKNGMV